MTNEFLDDRRRALEETYFAKHNRALIERLRAANESGYDAASGVAEDDDAARPAALDARGKSLAALSLAPLVAMAWAEGGVDETERGMVLEWAAELGLAKTDDAYRSLETWLAEPPGAEFLARWQVDYVDALCSTLSPEAKRQLELEMLRRARAIADATGPFSGIGQTFSNAERAVMQRIESAFR